MKVTRSSTPSTPRAPLSTASAPSVLGRFLGPQPRPGRSLLICISRTSDLHVPPGWSFLSNPGIWISQDAEPFLGACFSLSPLHPGAS